MNQTRIITGPATEPVTRTEAKLHLRVDHTDEDDLIDRLITAAREHVELVSRRALVNRTVELLMDGWPTGDKLALPFPPLSSITSIKYYDEDNVSQTMSAADYYAITDTTPGMVVLSKDADWPSAELRDESPVRVRFVAGYGAAGDVPARYKQAILLLVGHWFENREAVIVGTVSTPLQFAVDALTMGDRAY